MAHPGFRNYEYIIRDHCVPNLGKFRQICAYMIRLWNTTPITFKICTSKFLDTLKMVKCVNFDKFQMLTHYDVIVDHILGQNSRIANIYPFVFKICAKMLFGALIMIVSMESDIFQILVHYHVIIDTNLGKFGPKF